MQSLVVLAVLLPVAVHCAALYPLECGEIQDSGAKTSGVYRIFPAGPNSPRHAYCDMDTDGGRWTVFQRRMDGTVNFYRGWDEYKYGFGSAAGEHWLGLDTLELLMLNQTYELRVDMEDFEGESAFAHYTTFSIGSEQDGYRLNIGDFKDGAAKDALKFHKGQKFSTYDRDQDDDFWKHCAKKNEGAFWFKDCANANPNGVYLWGEKDVETGVSWWPWKRNYYSLKSISMKIRPLAA